MKIKSILENVIKFPGDKRKPDVTKTEFDPISPADLDGILSDFPVDKEKYVVMDDQTAISSHDNEDEAWAAKAEYMLKTGKRKKIWINPF